MPAHKIKSPVVIFNHHEYGRRLLFQQGESNPRNQLGKNGITLYNPLSSLFYRTIRVEADLIDEHGKHEQQEFILNRNSLIKYLGTGAHANDSDEQLVRKLNEKLWDSSLNAPNSDDKQKQSDAGERLRHAGRYNQRTLSNWFTNITDFFKGTFLSWLYQQTIGGVNRIKLRFFFVGKEQEFLAAGEILAKKRFNEAYAEVPAYKEHITRFNGLPVDAKFRDIPVTTKENYIKYAQYDSDTHKEGKYPAYAKTDTSTGTTGKPTAWVRSEKELDTVKKSLQLAAKIQFGTRKLNYINAFALGPWATGLTTYELMRQTGSVFATGPDKDKIIDELVRIAKYEQHQLQLAVTQLQRKNTVIDDGAKKIISDLINNTLNATLQNRDLNLNDAFAQQIKRLDANQQQMVTVYKARIFAITKQLNNEKAQTIIAGYPPFLKDLAAYAQSKGHDLKEFSPIGIVGGQAISEAMRDVLVNDGFAQIYSSYGASDLDINLGVETEFEIGVRKAIEQNSGLARELYGANKGLPMIFHYDPMNYHVECLDKPEDKDSLLFTCARDDRSSARIRYDLGDKGRVYASSDIQALCAKYGIFLKPKTDLPLMFVWGRDSTVVFNGANLAFTELERAVTDVDQKGEILKKAFYTYHDERTGEEKLELWLELNEGVELPDSDERAESYAHDLIAKMAQLNQDFRYQLESLDEGAPLPMVRFFKRNQSPISEAGGHRKQVLVFQKENLPENYAFPDRANCLGVSIPMSAELLEQRAQAQL